MGHTSQIGRLTGLFLKILHIQIQTITYHLWCRYTSRASKGRIWRRYFVILAKPGTTPGEIVIHTDQMGTALSNYDANCKSNFSQEYDQERFLMAFESLQAVIYAEQLLIDSQQDKEAQLTDRAFLIWAYQEYYEPYKKILSKISRQC